MFFTEFGLVFMDKVVGESDNMFYKKIEIIENELKQKNSEFSLSADLLEKVLNSANKKVAKELYGCNY